ncbi:DUF5615 family PIN-like protein [Asticcacaulis sp. SL142]|uniref:DUF5615 family PIN-like protein n=1 Tax=Asticcacaulis sp. SL142 TaxID=2995155 RepID=UPI00226CE5C5|nr:DUF5615 family PIN-like protein [Asticcacaulis sp. SL142]WAC48084.1 DUF5615 family PIN-like protein [Asticcacaulis sp. SL142]
MRFLADHNLIEQISQFFEARQHDVLRVRDAVGAASPDFVVAQAALSDNRILLTQDRDFRTQQRRNRANRQVMESVHLIHICDLGPDTLRRVADIIDVIE